MRGDCAMRSTYWHPLWLSGTRWQFPFLPAGAVVGNEAGVRKQALCFCLRQEVLLAPDSRKGYSTLCIGGRVEGMLHNPTSRFRLTDQACIVWDTYKQGAILTCLGLPFLPFPSACSTAPSSARFPPRPSSVP